MSSVPYVQFEEAPRRFNVDPIISIKDAAALANCHSETLKNEAKRGRLTLIRISSAASAFAKAS
jgi:hypothetical protein